MIVKRKALNLFERLYLPAIIAGSKSRCAISQKKVTMQYPEEKWVVPEGYRGAPYLVKDQEGKHQMRELPSFANSSVRPRPLRSSRPARWPTRRSRRTRRRCRRNLKSTCFAASSAASARVCLRSDLPAKDYSLTGTSAKKLIYNKEKLLALGGVTPVSRNETQSEEAKEQEAFR